MNRKPIFDAVRKMLGRGFKPSEVEALDRACDLAELVVAEVKPSPPPPAAEIAAAAAPAHRLGSLSEIYESGNRGPGTVSSGAGDPGGVSYGVYQLSSKAGTLTTFMKQEGKPWSVEFGTAAPGTNDFTTCWKNIAAREPDKFRAAQHAFIERTHYRSAIAAVLGRTGLDLDSRHNAVRDATWSVAVQHRRAADVLANAIEAADATAARDDADYDRQLVTAIYKARTDYVLGVAGNPGLSAAERDQLVSITKKRYPSELDACLKMFGAASPAAAKPAPAGETAAIAAGADGTIDGNAVAKQHGVAVKSAAVKIDKLHPKMAPVIAAVAQAAKTLGLKQPVITSGNDSKHMKGSLHFKNRALDFRGNNISDAEGKALEAEVRTILGKGYDVIFEISKKNPVNDHLHVEYDPK